MRASTGCASTALAQIFSYTEYPTSMTINYDNSNIHTLNINWNTFKAHIGAYDSCNCTSDIHYQLSEMFRQIGKEVNANYDEGGNTTNSQILNYLNRLGYSHSGLINYSHNTITNSISNNRIVYITGNLESTNTGHGWVLDGYKRIKKTTNKYKREYGQFEWTLISSSSYEYSYDHFNWGWDGNGNGYFSINVFCPSEVEDLDEGVINSYSTSDYSSNVKIIANINH